ncbi:MAG: InlB B-repeat-containing protein [Atopobiaceae bacterium]|jgi:uncharacterized repeat protein (TIGR02543 family)|nr:InlB B-repeat-containing protein [Atopobiaceae bacterium]MCI1226107.1 InlB B-repeat-containing protein [Atopobiaceae bacterium]MCI1259867.1 InlB B-repeat-containing protein [Atopobiaceae bacterium]MDD2588087.1 InlB B-repeat-containing protein [Atopobiaceae bacterium]
MRSDPSRKALVIILSVAMALTCMPVQGLAEAVDEAQVVTSSLVGSASASLTVQDAGQSTADDAISQDATSDQEVDASSAVSAETPTATDDDASAVETAAATTDDASTTSETADAQAATTQDALTVQSDDLVTQTYDALEILVDGGRTITISDASESGMLKISGLGGNPSIIPASASVILTSEDGAAQDSMVNVVATKSTVKLELKDLKLRHDGDSPLRIQGGSTVVATLEGSSELNCVGGGQPGVQVQRGASLTITGTGSLNALGDTDGAGIGTWNGASISMGSLTITGGAQVTATGYGEAAGIGCGNEATSGGTVTITGAGTKVTANGGKYGAGIGGGDQSGGCNVIISDGASLTATGGYGGAGIGSGDKDGGSPGTLTVSGDDTRVTAIGGEKAAGVGTGRDATHGGTVTVNGGILTATGGEYGAGIGGGYETSGSTVIINGGTVVARHGGDASGIGSGSEGSNGGSLTINGGSVLGSGTSGFDESVQPTPKNADGVELERYSVQLQYTSTYELVTELRLYDSAAAALSQSDVHMWTIPGPFSDCAALYLYLPKGTDLGYVTTNIASYNRLGTSDIFELYQLPYLVHFDSGVDDVSGTMPDQIWRHGERKSLSPNTFSRPNYFFAGWSKTKGSTKADYSDKQVVTEVASNDSVTLYAVWIPMTKNATLTYASSDASHGTVSLASETLNSQTGTPSGSTVTVAAGYHLVNWTDSEGTVVSTDATYVPVMKNAGWVDENYTANIAPNTYTLTYCDSVTGRSLIGGDYSYTHNPFKYTITLTYDAPTTFRPPSDDSDYYGTYRAGYCFDHWSQNRDGTGTTYTEDQEILNLTDVQDGHVDVWYIWRPINYSFAFLGNGATSGSMTNEVMTYDQEKALTANAYARTGYTFVNWNHRADGSSWSYSDQALVKNTTRYSETLSLYAQWKPNSYTVTFDGNGADSGSMAGLTLDYDESHTLDASTFTRAGYTFAGWNTAADGTGTAYADAASIKNLATGDTGDTSATLYAQWKGDEYTVKFVANGGDGTMADQTLAYGTAANLNANTFTCTGYTFAGWADDAGHTYADGASVMNLVTSGSGSTSITLKAQWTANTYTLVFDANGGTGTMDKQSMTYDTEVALTPCAFAREGCMFAGWTDDAGHTYADAESVKNLATEQGSTATLHARWKANTYTVKFATGVTDGSVTQTMEDETMTYGIATPLTANAFIRAGYRFLGWKVGDTSRFVADEASVSDLATSGTVTLTAMWESWPDALVSYNVIDPAQGTVSSAKETLTQGQGTPAGSTATAGTGYTFSSWKVYGSDAVVSSDATLTAEKIKASPAWSSDHYVSTNFVASFEANTYTVTFDASGGSGTMDPQALTYGTAANLDANTFAKTGYTFAGWSDGAGHTYADKASVKNLVTGAVGDESITLTAQWTQDLVVTYVPDDVTHGTVSVGSETVVSGDNAQGSTAEAATGYTFVSWTLAGSTTPVSVEQTLKPAGVTASASYVANFKGNAYTVTFATGVTDGSVTQTMADEPMTYGTAKELTANAFTRPGYRFLGWRVGDSSRFVADKASVSDLATSGTVTLTAMWEAWPDALISYNVTDPAQGSVSSAKETLVRGQGTPVGSTATAGTGYTFVNWTVYGSDTVVSSDATLTAEKIKASSAWSSDHYVNTDLVANFKANTYTVTFDANGGSGTMTPQTLTYDTPANLNGNAFAKTGFTFAGWSDGAGHTYADASEVENLATGAAGDASVTLTAQWVANGYTVTFDATGGTGTMPAQPMTYGAAANLTACTLVRTGYAFLGWSKTQGGTIVDLVDEASVTDLATSGTVPLYAVWQANSYTIEFNGNGATSGTMADLPMTYDTAANLTANAYAKDHYTFTGWNTKADGSGTPYAGGDSVANLATSGTVILYAQWSGDSYDVTFEGNGSTSGTMQLQGMTYGSSAKLTPNGFVRADYTFLGWALAAGTTTPDYFDGQLVSDLDPTTLYAVWGQRADARIYYGSSDTAVGTVSSDSELVAPDTGVPSGSTAIPAAGHHFVVWKDASGAEVSAISFFQPTKPVGGWVETAYTASFAANTYTVKFDANGGTGTQMDDQPMTYGTAADLTANTYVNPGHAFVGWKDDAGHMYADGASVIDLTTELGGTVALHAQWTSDLVVSYAADEASHGSVSLASETVALGGTAQGSTATAESGYHLAGWTLADSEDVITTEATLAPTNVMTSASYLARFVPNTYTVTFQANGGTGVMDVQELSYDADEKLAACTLTREGYAFTAWADDSGHTYADKASVKDLVSEADGGITLHAQWMPIAYTVAFDANGGDGTMEPQAMTYGTAADLTASAFTRTGYAFAGWNTVADGSGTSFSEKASVKDLVAEDGSIVTLYAQWTVSSVDDGENGNGGDGNNAAGSNAGSASGGGSPSSGSSAQVITARAGIPATSDPVFPIGSLTLVALATATCGIVIRKRRRG